MRRGLTIEAWALLHRYNQSTVHYAINRSHQGRLSIEIRRRLRRELGLSQ
jgi:hypothetical protein